MSVSAADATQAIVSLALAEDLGRLDGTPADDLTTRWTVPPDAETTAVVVARKAGTVAGLDVARLVFDALGGASFAPCVVEGDRVEAGDTVLRLQGQSAILLSGERTALNFLQQLSGTATLTRAYVDAVGGTAARITDTRKTLPGQRLLQKRAVLAGGGVNHRLGLYDAVLIKENHAAAAGGVAQALERVRREAAAEGRETPRLIVEAETAREAQILAALAPDRIMLDNMGPEELRDAVGRARWEDPGIELEATGGIDLANVRSVALAGVDLISVGALTHSAPALDLSLLFEAD